METQFVELPDDKRNRVAPGFWDDLAANPGKWALWPGSHKSPPSNLAAQHSRNGRVYEGVRRSGKNYIRCVSA